MKKDELTFEISDELKNIIKTYLGTKPYVDVMQAMYIISKDNINESESNFLINILGICPYNQVEKMFAMMPEHIKKITSNNEKQNLVF